MIFILNKVWILFVIAMVLIPGFVEGFNFVGVEMPPEFVGSFPLFREFLVKESHQFIEVPTAVYDSLFGRLKSSNELFASTGKIVFEFSSLLFSDVVVLESDATSTNNKSGRSNNDSGYDWCFHFAMYLSLFVVLWIIIDFILDNDF